jgi:hypothetical protein
MTAIDYANLPDDELRNLAYYATSPVVRRAAQAEMNKRDRERRASQTDPMSKARLEASWGHVQTQAQEAHETGQNVNRIIERDMDAHNRHALEVRQQRRARS